MCKVKNVIPEKCCLNCHFLCWWTSICSNLDPLLQKVELTSEERKRLVEKKEVFNPPKHGAHIECALDVWTETLVPEMPPPIDVTVVNDRGESCFFFMSATGMKYPAAKELERRQAGRRESEKDRKLTRRAFYVSSIALIVSIITLLANLAWSIWTYYKP